MSASVRAIVFKTTKLKETKVFFENVVGFKLKESSHQHFVLYSKGIRIVFIETDSAFSVELFVKAENETLKILNDPNDLKVMVKNF